MNGKNLLTALMAAMMVVAVGLGCSMNLGSKPDLPTAEQQQAMVKETMRDFAKAIETGDFEAFHANNSQEFRTQVPTEKLKEMFKGMIANKDTFLPMIKSADSKTAQFLNTPAIKDEGIAYTIEYNGKFPTDPFRTRFEFKYVWQDSKWKLLALGVNFNSDLDKAEETK